MKCRSYKCYLHLSRYVLSNNPHQSDMSACTRIERGGTHKASHPLRQLYLNTQQFGITHVHTSELQYSRENQRANISIIVAESEPIRGVNGKPTGAVRGHGATGKILPPKIYLKLSLDILCR